MASLPFNEQLQVQRQLNEYRKKEAAKNTDNQKIANMSEQKKLAMETKLGAQH